MIEALDRNLAHFAEIVARDLGMAIRDLPGSGAAGGLGGGLVAFAGGKLEPGVELVIDAVGLADRLDGADLCLTGEGAIDARALRQDRRGSRPPGPLARLPDAGPGRHDRAGRRGCPRTGIDAYFAICPGPIEPRRPSPPPATLLEQATEQAVRAFPGRAKMSDVD